MDELSRPLAEEPRTQDGKSLFPMSSLQTPDFLQLTQGAGEFECVGIRMLNIFFR